MNATIKRTIAVVFILAFTGVIAAANFAFAAPNTSAATTPSISHKYAELMDVSDIIFYAPEPAKIELTETTISEPEPEPEPEEIYQEEETYYDYDYDYDLSSRGIYIAAGEQVSSSDFYVNGLYHDDEWSYTYYPESVRPGGGLNIPGRHTDADGYVCDENGNICVSSDNLPYGTVVDLPFGSGTGVVYDSGSGYGNLDIYTSW